MARVTVASVSSRGWLRRAGTACESGSPALTASSAPTPPVINLLRNDAKSGAGWFFEERWQHDQANYAPFARPTEVERAEIYDWLAQLPLALERDDLRIVHAAWQDAQINAVRVRKRLAVAS